LFFSKHLIRPHLVRNYKTPSNGEAELAAFDLICRFQCRASFKHFTGKDQIMSSIEKPTHSETVGTFNNILYVRHRGEFRGETVRGGEFSVPYEITVPKNQTEGEHVFVFEPPHLASGLIARNSLLGEPFLFNHGYSHASCGFGNRGRHILDPAAAFELKIRGQVIKLPPDPKAPEVFDLNIMHQFAVELRRSSDLFGQTQRIYAVGFSESGKTVHDIYRSFGHKSFDLTFAGTADYVDPVNITNQNPIMVVNTEADFDARSIPNPNFPAYRYYHIAGGPHIPDALLTRRVFNGQPLPNIAGTTPINWLLFARGLFKSGDKWIRNGKRPPRSATFRLNAQDQIVRDDRHNALGGIRHPALELREARFIASPGRNGEDRFGDYRNPRQLTANEFPVYVKSFIQTTDALYDAGYLLGHGRNRLHREAQLKAPNTYTLSYRERLLLG
jgi:Alpha/beta hydrolase domain